MPSLEDVFIHHVEQAEAAEARGTVVRRLRRRRLKELRQIRRDPLTLSCSSACPAFMLLLYGFALNFDVRHVTLAVQDRDRSPASRELVASFTHSTYFDLVATPDRATDLERLTGARRRAGDPGHPRGLRADLATGQPATVQLLLDGTDATTATTVLGYARGLVAEANAELVAGALAGAAGRPARPALDLEPRVWYNPELESTQFLVPGPHRLHPDAHGRALDGPVGGAREGARHHGAAAGHAAAHRAS